MRSSKFLALLAAVSVLGSALPLSVYADDTNAADNTVTEEQTDTAPTENDSTENKDNSSEQTDASKEDTSKPVDEQKTTPQTSKSSGFEYRVTAEGKAIITGFDTDKSSCSIPETIDDNGTVIKVVGIDDFAFARCKALQSVSVPSSLTLEDTSNAAFITVKNIKEFLDKELSDTASFSDILRYIAKNANYKNGNFSDSDLADVSVKFKNKLDKIDISKADTVEEKIMLFIFNIDKMELGPDLTNSLNIWLSTVTYGGLTLCGQPGIPMEQYAQGRKFLDMNYLAFGDYLKGDANGDGKVNVRDAAFIASKVSKGVTMDITTDPAADFNQDGKVNVRDAAAIARELSKTK